MKGAVPVLVIVVLVGLAVAVPAARPVLVTVLVVVAVTLVVLVLVLVLVVLLLFLRAERDVRANPDLERPAPRDAWSGGLSFPDTVPDDGDVDPLRVSSGLMERLRKASTSPHSDVAARRDRTLDSAAHLVRNWVRGPDPAAVRSVHEELGRLLLHMAREPRRWPSDAERLRRFGAPDFRPRGRDWRSLGYEADTSVWVILAARVLVAGGRWREASAAYHRLILVASVPPVE